MDNYPLELIKPLVYLLDWLSQPVEVNAINIEMVPY